MLIFLVVIGAGQAAHDAAAEAIDACGAVRYGSQEEFWPDGVQDPYRAVVEADAIVWVYDAANSGHLSATDYNPLYGDDMVWNAVQAKKPILFYSFVTRNHPPLPNMTRNFARRHIVKDLPDFLEALKKDLKDLLSGVIRFGSVGRSPEAVGRRDLIMRETAAAEWDVFISHASEDKDSVARPLANLLASHKLRVWLDEAELHLGDSLRGKIDEGLARSFFGVVVLSPSFFSKNWPKAELDGLMSKEDGSRAVILPVWHSITFEQVREKSPLLAGRAAADTKNGLRRVAQQISAAIESHGRPPRPHSPFFVGRLTKKALMSFEEGSFLRSNILYLTDKTPGIAERLGDKQVREALWVRIRTLGLAGTLFHVYRDADSYRKHMAILCD